MSIVPLADVGRALALRDTLPAQPSPALSRLLFTRMHQGT